MSLTGPFPASSVIERLAALPELRIVEGAAGLQAAIASPPRAVPAAYVLVEETGRDPADFAEHYAQPMTATINVVLWARHVGDSTGAKVAAMMEGIERAVRTALRDWSPSPPFEPLWVSHSGADKFFGGQLTRQVIFRTHYRDQEQP